MSTSTRDARSIAWAFALLVIGVSAGWSFGVNAGIEGQASTGTAAPDVTKLGPQVGEKVPDFSLPDQHGTTRTLASLMGPKGLVLVFNRSADW
jgi:cytochrome oxidase Cu insertion factor (SCO1/SenC/PrrC family)